MFDRTPMPLLIDEVPASWGTGVQSWWENVRGSGGWVDSGSVCRSLHVD